MSADKAEGRLERQVAQRQAAQRHAAEREASATPEAASEVALRQALRDRRQTLRDEMKRVRAAMEPSRRAALSKAACGYMLDYLEALGAHSVMAYAPVGDELDTWGLMTELLVRGIRLYLPRVLPGRQMAALEVRNLGALEKGVFGVMEPRLTEMMIPRLAGMETQVGVDTIASIGEATEIRDGFPAAADTCRPTADASGDAADAALAIPPLDAVIVPGLAFDCAGFRLGYGAGYYDRFLSHTAAHSVGLAFDCQLYDVLPSAPWDVPVQAIVTESGVMGCGDRRPPSSPLEV